MGGVFTTYEKMCLESQRLDEQINSLLSQISCFPEGKLVCTKDRNNSYKWYCSDGHKSVYIPKKERKLAEQLAVKRYLSFQLQDLQKEKRAIDFYLRHHVPSKSEELLENASEYRNLLLPHFKPQSEKLLEWTNSDYESNPKFPNQKIHKTSSGVLVRSKSETLIERALFVNKIPFRYECALQIGSVTIYPDFTIMHPITGELFYWEHFGMMDNSRYAKSAGEKLQLYMTHGIIPSINLITTYETLKQPLSYEEVEKIVLEKFMN